MSGDLRGLAKNLNANAVDLIEQVLQKHTAAILDVVREQTHELQAEREKVRVLRGAIIDIVEQSRDWTVTSIAEEALIETAEQALQATAQEDK